MTVRVRFGGTRGFSGVLLFALEALLLFVGGVFLLLFAASNAERYWGQYAAVRTFERQQVEFELPDAPTAKQMAASTGVVGRLQAPDLGLAVAVYEGVDRKTLRRGAGRLPSSAFPGEAGNVAISAHRDTFFRPLRHITTGQKLRLETVDGAYEYEVEWTKVVEPTAVEVVDPTPEPSLTLITCYPFYYVGNAPERFVVRARQISP